MTDKKRRGTDPARIPNAVPRFALQVKVDSARPGSGKLELNNAPGPTRMFCADAFFLKLLYEQVRIVFFQRKLDGKTIRSMLELRMNLNPFKNWLNSFPPIPENAKAAPYFELTEFEEPAQTIALEVTFGRLSANQASTNFDFYYSAGRELARGFESDQSITIDEVVTVQLPNIMFLPFFISASKLGELIKVAEVKNV